MGLGRREFIRLMSIALAGAALESSSVVSVNDDYYVNRKLGVIFEKPPGWGFIHVQDFGQLKEKQTLSNIALEDEEDFWETIGYPACMVTKYYEDLPKYEGVFSPTIQFFVNHKSEFEDLNYETFEEFILLSEIGVNDILKNFKIVKKKRPFVKDGVKFFEYFATYDFEHIEIKGPLEVNLNVLIAEHNNFYYFINFHDSPAQNQIASEEFRTFKQSIRLI